MTTCTPFKHPISKSIIWATFLLISLGILCLYATSALKGAEQLNSSFFFVKKQIITALVSCSLIIALQFFSYRSINHLTLPLLFSSLFFLSLIYLPGVFHKVGGASRWIRVFSVTFQPSELAKISLIFFLAKNLSRPKNDISNFRSGVLPNLIVVTIFVTLLLKQPDFGTAALLVLVFYSMLFLAGASLKLLAYSATTALCLAAIAIFSTPYRFKRVLSFLDPWQELQNGGFQIIQSYLGFQNGGVWGAGLGESRQKLFFLPEAHTDFIFSVIGEELGLIGSSLICLLFFFIVSLGLIVTYHQKNNFHKYLAFGITILIAGQSFFNLGVVMGILPTKGIPLPFISSGSSSLLVFSFAIGILAKLGQEVPTTYGKSKTNI